MLHDYILWTQINTYIQTVNTQTVTQLIRNTQNKKIRLNNTKQFKIISINYILSKKDCKIVPEVTS